MQVSADKMLGWCQTLLGLDPNQEKLSLAQYLAEIPRLESLAALPAGTPVLVRGDVDEKPAKGDIRLRSMVQTLKFGQQRGWKQVIFGHIGREPGGSLADVAAHLGKLLGCSVPLVDDWLDEASVTIADQAAAAVRAAQPGSILVLQHARKYAIETVLWKAKPADLPALAPKLARLANEFAAKIAATYVNEALSAGSLDSSTTIVPAAMDRVALGSYVAGEFSGPMIRCLDARLVVFSGLKADKLDDMEAVVGRGQVKMIFVGGSLAMGVKKAAAQNAGGDFCIGEAEHPEHAKQPYFWTAERLAQARRLLTLAASKGIEFVLPVDFVLGDERIVERLGPNDQSFDAGPKTSEHFAAKIAQFIAANPVGPGQPPAVVFYNGVLGMFEDPRFAKATERFIPQLKRMKDAGLEVYVGGGEGGKALKQYGKEDWVSHLFTAGGTVLNALGSDPVPYLVALRMAAGK